MTTILKERPILFSGPMVRAILTGTKTQTRRVIRPQPTDSWMLNIPLVDPTIGQFGKAYDSNADAWQNYYHRWFSPDTKDWIYRKRLWIKHPENYTEIECPYGAPGERLWVRETWLNAALPGYHPVVLYRADGDDPKPPSVAWKPSIHIKREYSRLSLEVVSVRVERLNEISEADAKAEGAVAAYIERAERQDPGLKIIQAPYSVECFRQLWNSINGARADWGSNPWVWVVEFKRVEVTK